MKFIRRAGGFPRRLAVLAGSFNPPTRAHAGLAEAALQHADEVLFAVPSQLPHKEFHGASVEQRAEMLDRVVSNPGISVGIAEGGLLIEIARELRAYYPESEILMICGRDVAERIVNWPYEDTTIEAILDEFRLLVASRNGGYDAPASIAHAVETLRCDNFDEFSSTEVRERIGRGDDWRDLVPVSIHDMVQQIYG